MKKILIVLAVVGLAACETTYRATDTGVVVVNDATLTSFSDQYPNADNVVWARYDASLEPLVDWDLAGWRTMDESDYVVQFDMNNEPYYAWYDADGNWVGTAYVVRDYKTLPSSVSTTLNTQFPSYSISKVNREFQKDRTCYEVVLTRSSDDTKIKLLLDSDGTVLRQKTKMK